MPTCCKTVVSRLTLLIALIPCAALLGQDPRWKIGNVDLANYFESEVRRLENRPLAGIQSRQQWQDRRPEMLRQLREMLGLDPLPERTPLNPVITGKTEQDEFVVEKLHFESRPGLIVTANLYRPRKADKPLPAVLYVCGHGAVKKDGISYGNKVHYHRHGSWFARNGYVCLTIDSLQLGEIEGIHHGTYRYDMWWWLDRGYTPAGVEAWNCIRALDYLQTRPEVDGDRLGVTGRSGGGAYSWWVAALDERIKAAVPVAGITDLRNHVVDGCVEGHCDCMYFVNTYRWDYATLAALVAPRPLLISNTDSDRIFPLDGVVRVFQQAKPIYQLHGQEANLALQITAGPHKDTQELRIHAFRWFNQHLQNTDKLIESAAHNFFEPADLKVLSAEVPENRNAEAHEWFVPAAAGVPVEQLAANWDDRCRVWRKNLKNKSFAGWPEDTAAPTVRAVWQHKQQGLQLAKWQLNSQEHVQLPMWTLQTVAQPTRTELHVLDDESWETFRRLMACRFPEQMGAAGQELNDAEQQRELQLLQQQLDSEKVKRVYLLPRGLGSLAWTDDPRRLVQIHRRFYLLGQTLDGMRSWDIRQALAWLAETEEDPIHVVAGGKMAANVLYTVALFNHPVQLRLHRLPTQREELPHILNSRKILSLPQLLAMVATRVPVEVSVIDARPWSEAAELARRLNWPKQQLVINSN